MFTRGTPRIDLDTETGQFTVPTEDTDGDAWDLKWPIMMVNQHDARILSLFLSEMATISITLRAEWEFAARGSTGVSSLGEMVTTG